jgi:hypothetical protein
MKIVISNVGDWFSVYGYAERVPPRVSLTITFGDLPEGWTKPRKPRVAGTWIGVLGLLLIAPFLLLIAAYLLRAAGVHGPYDAIAGSPPAILAATLSFFIGFPVAFVLNVVPITRLALRRHSGVLEALLAVEFAPLHLAVVLTAMVIGFLFVGHLAADSYACWKGVRSAC